MQPLISVIVPVYQVKEYLIKCLDSIINQTYKKIEIILVDDGSTDGSGRLCDEYAKRDNRITVFHKANGGLSSARNVGIEHAKGEYLAFIDSDDWVDLRYLEVLYKMIQDTQSEIAQCAHWNIWSEDLTYFDYESKPFVFTPRELEYAYHTIELWQSILAWNKLYKASLFRNIRYPEGRIHEDEYTSYKVIWEANKVAVTYTKLYYYRHRKGSIKTKKYSYRRLDAGTAYREKEKFYEDKGEHILSMLTRKRHRQWLKQQITHIVHSNLENQEEIIKRLNSEIVKLEKILMDENVDYQKSAYHGFLFPYGLIKQGSNIVLYGAGDVGVQYFRQITMTNYCSVCAWIDKNNDVCNQRGVPAKSLDELIRLKEKYDYLVIAVCDHKIALEIINDLEKEYAVDKDKIIYDILIC